MRLDSKPRHRVLGKDRSIGRLQASDARPPRVMGPRWRTMNNPRAIWSRTLVLIVASRLRQFVAALAASIGLNRSQDETRQEPCGCRSAEHRPSWPPRRTPVLPTWRRLPEILFVG